VHGGLGLAMVLHINSAQLIARYFMYSLLVNLIITIENKEVSPSKYITTIQCFYPNTWVDQVTN